MIIHIMTFLFGTETSKSKMNRNVYFLMVVMLLTPHCSNGNKSKKLSRLQCLQKPFGDADGHWVRGRISDPSPPSNETDYDWIYEKTKCPLKKFNLDIFCKSSLGCGKHMLVVGDSTSSSLIDFWTTMLPTNTKFLICTSDNHCSSRMIPPYRGQMRGCHDDNGRVSFHRQLSICSEECDQSGKDSSTITFFRHDYLINTHGFFYHKSTVCEKWWSYVETADVVMVSFGPHIESMREYPYNYPPAQNFDVLSLVEETARNVSYKLKSMLKPDAVVVYRTSHHGIHNPIKDCLLEPLAAPYPPEKNYSWDLIPVANQIYMKSLKRHLGRGLLIMNHQNLLNMRIGCRNDFIHFATNDWHSPIAMDWQILQNILEVYHKSLS